MSHARTVLLEPPASVADRVLEKDAQRRIHIRQLLECILFVPTAYLRPDSCVQFTHWCISALQAERAKQLQQLADVLGA